MKLTGETKFFLGVIVASVLLVAGAAFFFSRPTPAISKEKLISSTAHTKGPTDAKAYLVEFSDFQCPACLSAKPTVDAILTQYKDQLQFAYLHYPLSQHKMGEPAARAAEAAAKQGKFWEMYDLLFQNQKELSEEKFVQLAQSLELDQTKFMTDYKSGDVKDIVFADQAAGNAVGVNSTPTFYLNGRKLELFSFSDLKTEVEKALK